jgi:hypothetical protein
VPFLDLQFRYQYLKHGSTDNIFADFIQSGREAWIFSIIDNVIEFFRTSASGIDS